MKTTMNIQLMLLCMLYMAMSCKNESKNSAVMPEKQQSTFKPASSFFNVPKAKLLMVGTFHFNYPGLDGYVAPDRDKVDILSDLRQAEVEELANYIAQFKPTKIAIEATHSWKATEKLRAYKMGDYQEERGERFQLAMRIAKNLKLDTLYAIDALTIADELKKRYPEFSDSLWQDFNWRGESKIDSLYKNWFQYSSRLNKEASLLESFKYANSKESLEYAYAANFSADFALEGYTGPDVMSIYWYNRNLRTVRNIQLLTANSEDRILVIMGRGHIAMLQQFFNGSPEYEVMDFNGL